MEKMIQNSENNLIKIELENGVEVVLDKSKLKEANEKIQKKFRLGKLKNFEI